MTDAVTVHYGCPDLEQRIVAAFESAGATMDVDGLAAVDEFHSGGRRATAALLEQLGLGPESHLLDIGCGIGGTARFAASTYGCRVIGIDLTAEYVETARALTDRVGLADLVEFRQASAVDLPMRDAEFDAVSLLHVGMNIEDKGALFAELARVLRPGGRCGVFDVLRAGAGDVEYPVPWADTGAISFLADVETYRDALTGAGLKITAEQDWTPRVLEATRHAPPTGTAIGTHLLTEDLPAKQARVLDAMRRGVLSVVSICATRP